jgi:potassium efflux system protein
MVFTLSIDSAEAKTVSPNDVLDIDRIQLVTQQIKLLKSRLKQGESDLTQLQKKQDEYISPQLIEKASKSLLDKASLDISVAKTNLDGINMELADSQQTILMLEKDTQEIDNQLNVLGMFGMKVARSEVVDVHQLRTDLHYQRKLLDLEKIRQTSLQHLQTTSKNALSLKKDKYAQLNGILRSRKMLHLKQKQMQEELAFQREQNQWLLQLNHLYADIAKVDPAEDKARYTALERDIFYTNENANFAYSQSLVARYSDQIQQMKLAISKSNSISLLNDVGSQVVVLGKQVNRLDAVLKSRIAVLEKHVNYLSLRKSKDEGLEEYIHRLGVLKERYTASDQALLILNQSLVEFRATVDKALQVELSARQGLPNLGYKTLLNLGKEMLLVPALTYQMLISFSSHVLKAFGSAGVLMWSCFAIAELAYLFIFTFIGKMLSILLIRPSSWRDQINSKWLSLQCLQRNLLDFAVSVNVLGALFFFNVPMQQYLFIAYFSLVWLIFKTIITVARLCLVETTHDAAGHDMRLYGRLKWFILAGALITTFTVFVHQLPLIYEIKAISDQLFLLLMMMVSILLLRSWDVVPNLILAGTEERHPYLQKSIRLIWVLIPILMFANSAIGLLGFVNLIMTVSWYEGIFLVVLIGYLILRGLLSDGMEYLSRILIQYVHNGWLWTEAFLKPLDKILRISLFLTSWAVLFLFYGWDKQSPIVERLTRLLHYQLVHALNTTITPLNIIELFLMVSVFYWTAKWTREFVFRLLMSRTSDMGIRNSIAILSQYCVVLLGGFICLRVLGIDLSALAFVASMFAFGIGFGLRDLANNFVCGFLILLERPLRVGDIVDINGVEGEVSNIGSRAVTVKTWDHMELVVPNAEIFNKSFTNWTARDNTVRTIVSIKISRYDDPHAVRNIIYEIFAAQKEVLKDPMPEVFLKDMSEILMEFELRYFVNIRQVKSRMSVASTVLMSIWDEFAKHGIKPPYPQQEIFLRGEGAPSLLTFSK